MRTLEMSLSIPDRTAALIDALLETGLYGRTMDEVIYRLITMALMDLTDKFIPITFVPGSEMPNAEE